MRFLFAQLLIARTLASCSDRKYCLSCESLFPAENCVWCQSPDSLTGGECVDAPDTYDRSGEQPIDRSPQGVPKDWCKGNNIPLTPRANQCWFNAGSCDRCIESGGRWGVYIDDDGAQYRSCLPASKVCPGVEKIGGHCYSSCDFVPEEQRLNSENLIMFVGPTTTEAPRNSSSDTSTDNSSYSSSDPSRSNSPTNPPVEEPVSKANYIYTLVGIALTITYSFTF